MFEKFSKHFNKEELKSILLTFFSIAAIEAIAEWNALFSGNFSKEALIALGGALLKSLLKAIFITEIKPKLVTQTATVTTVTTTNPPAEVISPAEENTP